jgi:S-adenosylmethionine-dependent methyltransferase
VKGRRPAADAARRVLAVRPALEGRYQDALSSLKMERNRWRPEVVTRGDTVEDLHEAFREASVQELWWYGVRTYLPEVLELEWEAGRREPYRSVARLIHLVGRKEPIQG